MAAVAGSALARRILWQGKQARRNGEEKQSTGDSQFAKHVTPVLKTGRFVSQKPAMVICLQCGRHKSASAMQHYDRRASAHLSRGEFLSQAATSVMLVGSLGCFGACMTKQDPDSPTTARASVPVTLTAAEKVNLDSNGFLNISGIVVIKDGTTYRAYSRICPHESGDVVGQSATSLQCQRHTEQFYNNFGQGNGARTSAALSQYTVTDNAGTLTIS